MSGTVLVAGAGGFVGSAVVRLLVHALRDEQPRFSDGSPVQRVVALLRPGGSRERLEELQTSADWEIARADLADLQELRDVLMRVRPRAVLYLAVHGIRHPNPPGADNHRVIVAPLETIFEGLADTPGARIIHTSSARVLGSGERLDESARLEPRNTYARNKAKADQLLPLLSERTGVDWINLRLFNIFGKYEHESQLLPYLVSNLSRGKAADLSHGDQVRDFNAVDDVARAYLLALQADSSTCGRVYHLGSGRGTRVRDFALTVASFTGNAHLIRFGAKGVQNAYPPCLVADPSRARQMLAWDPSGDLEARIREAVDWWVDRRAGTVPTT